MSIDNIIGWKKLLIDSFPEIDLDDDLNADGIDIDGNGRIEGPEVLDTSGDHYVDEGEAESFCRRSANRNYLAERIHIIRAANESGLSEDNPINDLILYEAQARHLSDEEVRTIYEKLGDILEYVKSRDSAELDPEARMALVHDALVEDQVRSENIVSFASSVLTGVYDCETSTFLLISVAHEMGWPVYAVTAPLHMFARWTVSEEEYINYEVLTGETHDDQSYIDFFNIDAEPIARQIYLRNLDRMQLEGEFLYFGATGLYENDATGNSIRVLNESVSRYATNLYAYLTLGWFAAMNGDEATHHAYLSGIIEIDPNNPMAYLNRAILYLRCGKLHMAIDDTITLFRLINEGAYIIEADPSIITHAKDLLDDLIVRFHHHLADYDPSTAAMLYHIRAYFKILMGSYENAAGDIERSEELDPSIDNSPMLRYLEEMIEENRQE